MDKKLDSRGSDMRSFQICMTHRPTPCWHSEGANAAYPQVAVVACSPDTDTPQSNLPPSLRSSRRECALCHRPKSELTYAEIFQQVTLYEFLMMYAQAMQNRIGKGAEQSDGVSR